MAKIISTVKKVKTSLVVSNPVAKEALETKTLAEDVLKSNEEAEARIKKINKDIKLNNKYINNIQEGKYTRKQQIADIDVRIDVTKRSNMLEGTKYLTKKEEQTYRGMVNRLDADMNISYSAARKDWTNEKKNPLYTDYKKAADELKKARSDIKKKGLTGRGVYKKAENYPSKIKKISEEVGEYKQEVDKLPPELKKLLGSDVSIYEHQIRELSDKIKDSKYEQSVIKDEIRKYNHKIDNIEEKNTEIDEKILILKAKKAKAYEERIPLAVKRSEYMPKTTIEYDENGNEIQPTGKSDKVTELNHNIYEDVMNLYSSLWSGDDVPPIFKAYARSHKLYYDSKTKELEYYDKNGNGWGLFENEIFYMDYEVSHPNGPIIGKQLSSYGIIEMADKGRKPYTIVAGKHTIHNFIAIPGNELIKLGRGAMNGGEFEGGLISGSMDVPRGRRGEGYFAIGLRKFVSKTIRKYKNIANKELKSIRKQINKLDKIIKNCNQEIKSINVNELKRTNNNAKKHCELEINKLNKKYELIEKTIEKDKAKLKKVRETNRLDAKMRKIQKLLSNKRKYESWLGNYKEQQEYLNELESKAEKLRIEAKEKYIERRKKELYEERKQGKEEILNSKLYQKYKKFHEDNDEKNQEIIARNQEIRDKKIAELENLKSSIEHSSSKNERVDILNNQNSKLIHEKEEIKKQFNIKKDELDKAMSSLKTKLPKVKEVKKQAKKAVVKKGVEEVKKKVQKDVDKKVEDIVENKLNISVLRKWIDNVFDTTKKGYKKQKSEIEVTLKKYYDAKKINKSQYEKAMEYINKYGGKK